MSGRFARLGARWPNVPIAGGILALLLLLGGIGVIALSSRSTAELTEQQTQVQARILAATVTAALDFGDTAAANEAVSAFGANPQVSDAAVYDRQGAFFAGYSRAGSPLPRRLGGHSPASGKIDALAPVARGGARIGTVWLRADREPVSRRVARYSLFGVLALTAALVVLILGIGQTTLRRANRELAAQAEDLARANAELKVQIEERGKAEEQLRQAQKMQALGQLTGGIAHDFNNLLTVIQGSADMLRRPGMDEAKRLRFAEAIARTAARAAALTSQLLAFARRQPLKPEVIDLNARIEGMAELLDRALGERIAIRIELEPDLCPIEADPAQLEAAILNIAVNARDAMPGGGTLAIATAAAPPLADGRPAVRVAVTDTGAGIDAAALEHVFEPFFTTKSVGKGTGLGLSQVYGFATQSGGEVHVDSHVGVGTTVTLILPCSERGSEAPPGAERGAVAARSRARILVVDDNEEVGFLAETLLRELGHGVSRATSGAAALATVERGRFDLVLTDVVMPGMSGLELAERLAAIRPGLPVILSTGFSDEIARSGTGGRSVLYKPYRLDSLAEAIDAALSLPDEIAR
ncbi:MAG: response regulator [Alphaproteobacteria bacterium]|nr:response regulator [Alphaproteobacteria bacterium]